MALYQNRFIGTTSLGTTFMHTLWVETSVGEGTAQSVNGQAVDWLESFMGSAGSVFPTDIEYTSVSTSEVDEETLRQTDRYDEAVTLPGTNDTDMPLPADVALVVSLNTDLPTRSGRGRFYLPQMTAGSLSDAGRVNTDTITTLVGAIGTAFGVFNATTTPVIWSRTDRVARPITTFNIGDLWDTIRGRDARANESRTTGTV